MTLAVAARHLRGTTRAVGALFLSLYVATIGTATYLMKVSLKDLDAYQINVLMGVAMLAVSMPAALLADRTLRIPRQHLGLGSLVATLMAAGSVFYALALARLPAGPAAAIATSYVIIVVALSTIFLDERFDLVTASGVVLTLAGVALLSLRARSSHQALGSRGSPRARSPSRFCMIWLLPPEMV